MGGLIFLQKILLHCLAALAGSLTSETPRMFFDACIDMIGVVIKSAFLQIQKAKV